MDFGHLDDQMDIASSPARYPHNLDVEYDRMRDRSVEPTNDNEMDDFDETGEEFHRLNEESGLKLDDDRMSDANQQDLGDAELVTDLDMEVYEANRNEDEDGDEEFLYEEEDMLQQNEFESTNRGSTQQQDIDLVPHETDQHNNTGKEVKTEVAAETNGPNYVPELLEQKTSVNQTENQGFEHVDDNLSPREPTDEAQHEFSEEHVSVTTNMSEQNKNNTDTYEETLPQSQNVVTQSATSSQSENSHNEPSVEIHKVVQTIVSHSEATESKAENTFDSLRQDNDTQNPSESDKYGVVNDEHHEGGEADRLQPLGLHAVKVIYLGEEMSLFPSTQEGLENYFVSDVTLAYAMIEQLLAECRQMLADTLGHEDELVLDIPILGLHICEDSKFAEQITLAQIVEVYLALHQNEQIESVGPMYCNLSSRVSLASQYAYLAGAAQEGKTFSEIAADYVDSPEEGLDNHLDASVQQTQDHPEVSEALFKTKPSNEVLGPTAEVGFEPNQKENGSVEQDTNVVSKSNVVPSDGVTSSSNRAQTQSANDTEPLVQPEYSDSDVGANTKEGVQSDLANIIDHSNAVDLEISGTNQANVDQPTTVDNAQPGGEFEESYIEEETYTDNIANYEDLQPPVTESTDNGIVVNDDFDHYEVEELFFKSDDEQENAGTDLSNNKNPFEDRQTMVATEDSVASVEQSTAELPEPTPPVTPIKVSSAKRKALEDDDEFDLLDSGTPEPKRRRPS